MSRPLILWTGLHTGTHFARMLLQMHARIGWCVLDNDFVDVDRRPGYTLDHPGFAHPGKRGPAAGETTFGRLLLTWFSGELPTAELCAYYEHWRTGLRIDEHTAVARRRGREIRRSLNEFGIRPPKAEHCRPLLHDHMRAHHVGCTFSRLPEADVVVTLRHPLLTVLSVQRWATNSDTDLWDFWHCLEHVYDLAGLHFLPIDRPADQPFDHADFQRRLGLHADPHWLDAAAINPTINQTSERNARGDPACLDPELLVARRQLVEENRLHPLLVTYWRHFRRLRCFPLYEQFYDFRFAGHA